MVIYDRILINAVLTLLFSFLIRQDRHRVEARLIIHLMREESSNRLWTVQELRQLIGPIALFRQCLHMYLIFRCKLSKEG